MSYALRFIKTTLYRLKRRYGVPVNIVWRTSSSPNLDTGEITDGFDSILVNQGIVLPSKVDRQFAYDLTFIASNKNFTYGGLFDVRQRQLVIDRSDLPADFEIKEGYWLVFGGKRYDVQQISEFDEGYAYFVKAKQVENHDLKNFIQKHGYSLLSLSHTVEVTVQ